jgi:hypothetical protein
VRIAKASLAFLSSFILFSNISNGQTSKTVTDYLKVPGPVTFDNKSYKLSWSSHPTADFYKQEYLPAGESADGFKSMILLDVLTGNLNVKDIVAGKVAELKKMKEANPVINYEIFDNSKSGEYMLDFLLTANGVDGKINIAERNVYRYTSFTDAAGKKGVLLFGVSVRSYGKDITTFLTNLKKNKKDLVDKTAQFKMPAVNVSK